MSFQWEQAVHKLDNIILPVVHIYKPQVSSSIFLSYLILIYIPIQSLARMNACTSNTTFSEEQVNNILVTLSCTGMVSSITCLIAALMVPCLKLYKLFAYRLALYQVLASLFFSLTISLELMAFNYDTNSDFSREACEAVGFLTQYSTWVKVMFTLHVLDFPPLPLCCLL